MSLGATWRLILKTKITLFLHHLVDLHLLLLGLAYSSDVYNVHSGILYCMKATVQYASFSSDILHEFYICSLCLSAVYWSI